ncbi:MAG: hypothetical protein HZB51_10660 [Chloroflexi bacterium]|nr:hypothetical protein [Chloroflexota bacterium]
MLKHVWFILTVLVFGILSTIHTASAQSGSTGAFSAPLDAYLTARGDHATKSYVTDIAASPANAWNAGVTTFRSAPQQVGPITLGIGQTTLPGVGPVTPTGSYKQDLVIPNGVPVLGNWNTGIQTTVNTYVDSQGHRIEAAVDPLSAFNYALTHDSGSAAGRQTTGYAYFGNWLAQTLNGTSGSDSGASTGALRLDFGLTNALNSNFGQGFGNLFGVGVYIYNAPEVPSGDLSGYAQHHPGVNPTTPIEGTSASAAGSDPLPTESEEVYLKAVIPQPEPDFKLAMQPDYPVVIGQDLTKRGVDVYGRATLGACTVIWHHVLRTQWEFCGKSTCDCSKDTCSIRETTQEWDTTEVEPDHLQSASIDSTLNAKSVAYILGAMQQIYPGAKVQQGTVRVYPSTWAQVVENAVGAPTTWTFVAQRVPYSDPGSWDFSVALQRICGVRTHSAKVDRSSEKTE